MYFNCMFTGSTSAALYSFQSTSVEKNSVSIHSRTLVCGLKEATLSVSQECFNFIILLLFMVLMLGSCQEYEVQMFLLKKGM